MAAGIISKSSATHPAGLYVISSFAEVISFFPGAKSKVKFPIGNSMVAGNDGKLKCFFFILTDSAETSALPFFTKTENSTASAKRAFVAESAINFKGDSSYKR